MIKVYEEMSRAGDFIALTMKWPNKLNPHILIHIHTHICRIQKRPVTNRTYLKYFHMMKSLEEGDSSSHMLT